MGKPVVLNNTARKGITYNDALFQKVSDYPYKIWLFVKNQDVTINFLMFKTSPWAYSLYTSTASCTLTIGFTNCTLFVKSLLFYSQSSYDID